MTASDMFKTSFESREFRNALGLFATGVAVVTCVSESGEALACTVSSFNSVSLDPPLVLFSLANSAVSIASWKQATHYGVTLLHNDQAELSNKFARPMTDKWKDVRPVEGPVTGVPMVPHAIAWFECESYRQYEGGDHTIFLGKVLSMHTRVHADSSPLVFFKGRYRSLSREIEPALADHALWLHGW